MPNASNQVDIFDQLMTSPNPYANSANLQALFRNYLGEVRIPFYFNQTDLLAPTSQDIIAPFDGYISELYTIVQAAVTTGGTIKAQINGSDVTNAVNTVGNAAAKGTRARATKNGSPYLPGAGATAVQNFLRGDRITLVAASFATAGAVNGMVGLTPR
jgi:hypothetical protein